MCLDNLKPNFLRGFVTATQVIVKALSLVISKSSAHKNPTLAFLTTVKSRAVDCLG